MIPPPTIFDKINSLENIEISKSILEDHSDILDALSEMQDITIFLPTDDAWEGINNENLSEEEIITVLRQHVIQGAPVGYSTNFSASNQITLTGEEVTISLNTDSNGNLQGIQVDSANIVEMDILVANGVLHTIDSVLIPQNVTTEAEDDDSGEGSGSDSENGGDGDDQDGDGENAASGLKSGMFGVIVAVTTIAIAIS